MGPPEPFRADADTKAAGRLRGPQATQALNAQ